MRKLRAAVIAASIFAMVAVVSQGCSSKSPSSGFSADKPDAGATVDSGGDDGGGLLDSSGPTFQDDVQDGGNYTWLDSGCATATAHTHKDPVYLVFVIDGSGSMTMSNKWSSLVPALDAIFDDMLAQNDTQLGVGIVVFSDTQDPTSGSGPYPSSKDVFIAYVDQVQHDALRARYDTSQPSGGTPTLPALNGAYHLLENLVALPPLPKNGKKVVVLMTDGVPNVGGTQQQCLDAISAELAKSAPQGPIQTFAVGIGPFPSTDTMDYDPGFMGHVAVAGGTAPPGCNPGETQNVSKVCHFQITPNNKPVGQIKQDFIDAINAIRGQVQACEYSLELTDGGAGVVDPTLVNVVFTDKAGSLHVFLQDPTDGWTYDDPNNPTKVLLHGAACSEVKGDPAGKVQVILGCKTQSN
jgi:hypothetical protein